MSTVQRNDARQKLGRRAQHNRTLDTVSHEGTKLKIQTVLESSWESPRGFSRKVAQCWMCMYNPWYCQNNSKPQDNSRRHMTHKLETAGQWVHCLTIRTWRPTLSRCTEAQTWVVVDLAYWNNVTYRLNVALYCRKDGRDQNNSTVDEWGLICNAFYWLERGEMGTW